MELCLSSQKTSRDIADFADNISTVRVFHKKLQSLSRGSMDWHRFAKRYWRNGNGDVDLERTRPPYNGYPDGDGNRLMAGVLRGTAEASVVEISVDADAGTVGFTVDEGGTSRGLPKSHVAHPRRYELGGFPRGVALRPWAMLYLHLGDQVTLGGCVEERANN